MKYYFRLQHTLLNRHITEFGLPPSAGYPIALLVFVGLSFYLFAQTEMAEYIYLFVALSLVLNVGNIRRNAFVKSCYSKSVYYKIRLLENGFVAAPFLCFLLFKQCYFISGLLILGIGSAVFVNLGPLFRFSLPTPFYKQPFEFIVGFRKNLLLVFFAYFLTLMSLTVDNYNLGVFSLLLVFLIGLSFYGNPESPYFVWMHNRTAKEFLHHKVIIALVHSTVLSSPVTACMLLFYPKNWGVIIAIQGLGYLYLTCMVLAKYSNFPYKISLLPGILLGLGLWFPPLLLGIIPFFIHSLSKDLMAAGVINLENICKSYGTHIVLKDITMSFEKGKTYGLVGENGAGKTTLFKCIAGLECYEGQINSEYDQLKNHLGFLQTDPYFFEKITGREYIQLLCNARKIPVKDLALQNIFELPLDQYASTYSTGMKKKLALMGILLQNNDFFILDEPFNGVDIHSNIIITEIIHQLKSLGKIVVISSHIFSTLNDTCDEIYLLKAGKLANRVMHKDFGRLEQEMKDFSIGNRIERLGLS